MQCWKLPISAHRAHVLTAPLAVQEINTWLRQREHLEMRNWNYMQECCRMLKRLNDVWDQQTEALIATRREGISMKIASDCISKARTQSTGFIPRPKPGQSRSEAERVPAVRALRLFNQLVNRKVCIPPCRVLRVFFRPIVAPRGSDRATYRGELL